jgi:SAM-dependent methyltransferase
LEKFERLTACPACAGGALKDYKKRTFDFASLRSDQIKITDSQYGKIWDLSRCENCGHIFANPCPTPEFIDSLYSEVVDPLYDEEAPGRSKNFERVLSRLEKIRPEKGALFDVGAASGILLNLARARGWKPDGIEASSWAVRFAREKYHLLLREGFLETAPLQPGSYAAVTMIDFIEHTPRPFEALAKAGEILTRGGVLSLVTPDIRSVVARIAGKKWWHLRPGHLAYFSRKSLSLLLGRTGFSAFKIRKYSWTFSAHYLLTRRDGLSFLLKNPTFASFLKRIPIRLALGDSFEIYARKS